MALYLTVLLSMMTGVMYGAAFRNPAKRMAVIFPPAVFLSDVLYGVRVVFTFFVLYGILSLYEWKYVAIGLGGLVLLYLSSPAVDRGLTGTEALQFLTRQVCYTFLYLLIVTCLIWFL